MMIEEKILQIQSLQANILKLLIEVLQELEKQILDLNRQEQLQKKGVWAEGNKIQPTYAALTIQLKKLKNQPYNRVTLKDTGDFYEAFKAVFKTDRIEITSEDWKTVSLEGKYSGGAIFGLTDESMDSLRKLVKDKYIDKLRDYVSRN